VCVCVCVCVCVRACARARTFEPLDAIISQTIRYSKNVLSRTYFVLKDTSFDRHRSSLPRSRGDFY